MSPDAAFGAVLAGGRGSRLGGTKAETPLGGRPLIAYPLVALEQAGLEAVVCAKAAEVPRSPSRGSFVVAERTGEPRKGEASAPSPPRGSFDKPGATLEPRNSVAVLTEPPSPRHPLCGIVAALGWGGGRPVVAVACDLPFIEPGLLRLLAEAPEPLVVPTLDGRPQPLLARYEPQLLPDLEEALRDEAPLTRTVESLHPRFLTEEELSGFGDPRRLLFNVNTPQDLRRAESLLRP